MLRDVVWCDARGGSDETGRSASGATNSGVLTSVAVEVGGLQPFQVKGDPHSISQRWRKWKRALELCVLGNGITSDSQKHGLLLYVAGLEVQDVSILLSYLMVETRITSPR